MSRELLPSCAFREQVLNSAVPFYTGKDELPVHLQAAGGPANDERQPYSARPYPVRPTDDIIRSTRIGHHRLESRPRLGQQSLFDAQQLCCLRTLPLQPSVIGLTLAWFDDAAAAATTVPATLSG